MKLHLVQASLDNQDQLNDMTEVTESLTRMMQDVHSLTFELSTPVLAECGLGAAVSDRLEKQIEERHGIATEFVDDGQVKPLEEDIQVLLFRSIRELLVNVVKHSHTKRVDVTISRAKGQILVHLETTALALALPLIRVGTGSSASASG